MAEATFQEELQLLEKRVRELESGKLDLDDAMKRFEEGVALTRKLRKRLDEAEGRIEQLLADGSTEELDAD